MGRVGLSLGAAAYWIPVHWILCQGHCVGMEQEPGLRITNPQLFSKSDQIQQRGILHKGRHRQRESLAKRSDIHEAECVKSAG